MTICITVPGLEGYPSFIGFRASQYTYPPAPINPDPESTRQLQQLLDVRRCSGEAGPPGASRGAGLAEDAVSGRVQRLGPERTHVQELHPQWWAPSELN